MSDQPLTVSEVTQAIKQTLESFPTMWVVGELTSFTQHSSGHRYFTLSDDQCQLRCVMWRSRSLGNFRPQSGMEVLVQGELTLYERRGDYQLNALQMFPSGLGQQQLAFNFDQSGCHDQKLAGQFHIDPFNLFEIAKVLVGQLGDGDVVEIDFMALDQKKQQVQWAVVGIKLNSII